jgi:hypothetical protein
MGKVHYGIARPVLCPEAAPLAGKGREGKGAGACTQQASELHTNWLASAVDLQANQSTFIG